MIFLNILMMEIYIYENIKINVFQSCGIKLTRSISVFRFFAFFFSLFDLLIKIKKRKVVEVENDVRDGTTKKECGGCRDMR